MKAMDADGSLQAAFAKLDVDKSGYLDHKELRKALASVGMALDSSKVRVRLKVRVRVRVRVTNPNPNPDPSPSPNPNQYLFLNETLVAPIYNSTHNLTSRAVWIPPG